MARRHIRLLLWVMSIVLVGCGSTTPNQTTPPSSAEHASEAAGGPVQIPHVHGLGFSADGHDLVVAAHTGLRIYRGGRWQTPSLPVNDYMGYAPTDSGFYSSGHPGPGSPLPNPLGLVKSTGIGGFMEPCFSTGKGTPINPSNLLSDFHKLLENAGLPRMRFYDLRHSCASILAAEGVPARVAMEILGHSDIRVTQNIYTHVFDDTKQVAADAMDRMFGKEKRG